MLKFNIWKALNPSKYYICGKNNKVIIVKNGFETPIEHCSKIPKLKINVTGNNNIIKIWIPFETKNSDIKIASSDNNDIELGPNMIMNNTNILCERGNNQMLKIGANTTINSLQIYMSAGSRCEVGADCMFSWGIQIWASDFHAVLDKSTKATINIPRGKLSVGDHCWIGANVIITKNAIIPDNTIIANAAVVTKRFDEQWTAIGGNPARVLKTDIDWDRKMEIT